MLHTNIACMLVIGAAFVGTSTAQDPDISYNGLAQTPQMGWDNWNAFGCKVSEELLLETAGKIVDYGLRDLGYEYIILDDCWSVGRADNGTLMPNMTKFPHGMGYIADQLHGMGLKFGMYSSAGKYTCARYPASLGKEDIDAKTFAGWGVDYLKYDNCYNEGQEGTSILSYNRYKAMSDALNATGRPILYSMCNWGTDGPWNWASTIANSWRVSGDIYDSFDRADARCPCTTWDCKLPGFHCSVMNILNKVAAFTDKGHPGGWNDLDALEVGNSGMTDDEYKLHMSMWAMVKSPLIMGNDITLMDAKTLSILSNPAILAISQDPAGMPGFRVWQKPGVTENNTYSSDLYSNGATYFWTGMLDGGDYVVAMINAGPSVQGMSASMEDIFIDSLTTGSSKPVAALKETYNVHDLWANRMDDTTAQLIINNTAVTVLGNVNATLASNGSTSTNTTLAAMTYNATAMTYKDGLAMENAALLGQKVSVLSPGTTLMAQVPSHGIAMYRLRSQAGGSGMRKRDEL